MGKYCLETHGDGEAVIHRLDCSAYDLSTLLGLGCLVNLGEFATLADALAAVKTTHPWAVRCLVCCQAQIVHWPLNRQNASLGGSTTLSN
jgi:hypothetical protein